MWHRNKTKVLKKTEVLIGKLAKRFPEFMMRICEILGRLSEDVYSKEDEYILVKTKHRGRTDRRQKTVFRFGYIKKKCQVRPSKKWIWAMLKEIIHLSCGYSLGRKDP